MIAQLQKNTAYFEQLIHEKKIKKAALESQMAKIRGQAHGDSAKKNGPSFSLVAIAETLSKSHSAERLSMTINTGGATIDKKSGLIEEAKKPTDAEMMRRLKNHIFSLYQLVKGVRSQTDEGFFDDTSKVDLVTQMATI